MTITPEVDTKEPALPPIPDGAVIVTLKIARFNPEDPDAAGWQSFRVPCLPTDRLLNLLHYVKWYLDGTLTFRRSCAHGVCGSDAMRINGVNRLACKVLMRDLLPKNRAQETHHHHRTDSRPAGGEGPGGRHGTVLRRLPGGQAVPGRTAATRRPGSGSRARPTAPATTTPPNASCARAAPPAVPSTGARVRTSGPPRSSTPTGSSSTAATKPPPSASTSSTRSTACGAAARRSTARSRARVGSR